MKLAETIGVILAIGGLIQFINWIFVVSGIEKNIGGIISFFLSFIFTFLIIISIILYQHDLKIRKVTREFINDKNDKLAMPINKKGMIDIDPRVLLIVIALLFLYLLWKGIN